MKSQLKLIMVMLLSFVLNDSYADENDVFIDFDADGNITVDWVHPECVGPKASWGGFAYQIKYKKASAALWQGPIYSNGAPVFIPAANFESGNIYKFRVKYYGRKAGCRGLRMVRYIGTKSYYYTYLNKTAVFNEIQETDKTKKIHGDLYDKCMYPYTWPGGSLESVRIFQWQCWSNDPKAFLIDSVTIAALPDADAVTLKSQMLDYCIAPKSSSNEVGIIACSSPLGIFIKEPTLPGMFRLRNWFFNRCLYASDSPNGSKILHGFCNEQNDERQNFYFEDY